jgi:hypothetical protein
MEGWIKLHRKILGWEWFKDDNTFRVFMYLLLSANHKDKKWKGIDVKRGQVITGRVAISESLNISERATRTCLNRLKTTSEIAIKTTNRFSIVTICKYELYQISENGNDQPNDQPAVQQTTSKRPATDHNQEGKEEKKEENIRIKKAEILKKRIEEDNLKREEETEMFIQNLMQGNLD